MGRPGTAAVASAASAGKSTTERLAKISEETAGITHKEPGKLAVAGKTALAVAPTAALGYGAVKDAEFLATHSAMKEVEQAEEQRKERGQP